MNPQIQQLEDILDAILRGVQEVLQSGESLPEELQELIAQELNQLTSEIDQLYANEELEEAEEEQKIIGDIVSPPEEPAITWGSGGNIPTLEPAPHESSNINAFRYEPESGKLYVKFQGKYPQQNGPVYSYEGVPPNIYDVFRRGAVAPKTSGKNSWHTWKEGVSPSHGASMYALIRQGNYPYQRLS